MLGVPISSSPVLDEYVLQTLSPHRGIVLLTKHLSCGSWEVTVERSSRENRNRNHPNKKGSQLERLLISRLCIRLGVGGEGLPCFVKLEVTPVET